MTSSERSKGRDKHPASSVSAHGSQSTSLYYEFSLGDFVFMLLKGSWIIAIIVAGALALGVWWVKSTPATYTVSMVTAPARTADSGVSSSSGVGGIAASFLGVGSSTAAIPRYEQFLHLLTSVPMAERLHEKYQLLYTVKAESWDTEAGRWIEPPESFRKKVKRFFGLPPWSPPNVQALADFLRENVSISPIGKTAFRRVSMEHHDPHFAVTMLFRLYEEAEDMLREKAVVTTAAKIRYIENQLAETMVADHRQALLLILSEEEKTMMLVDAGAEFSAEMTEAPLVPTRPTSPRPVQTMIAIGLAGIAVGVVLILLLNMIRGRSPMSLAHRKARDVAGD